MGQGARCVFVICGWCGQVNAKFAEAVLEKAHSKRKGNLDEDGDAAMEQDEGAEACTRLSFACLLWLLHLV